MRNPIPVIYILGVGWSGSTLLDTILGNHPDIESVGELSQLVQRGWLKNGYCACRQRGLVCPFWTRVRHEWTKRTGIEHLEDYAMLQATFESRRGWFALLSERRHPSSQFQAYAFYTRLLFESIQVASGKRIVVDSSKNPTRAFALSLMPGIELQLFHLVRDGRGVYWSSKKRFSRKVRESSQPYLLPLLMLRTARVWVLNNLLSNWIRYRVLPTQSILLRYEDLVADPRGTLDQINRSTQLDFSAVAEVLCTQGALPVGHTIAGNHLRMEGQVRLQADMEWQQKLSVKEQWIVWLLTGWCLRLFGYTRQI